MKANLFALFCITLFVLSVPQAFAEDTNSTVTTNQPVEENSTETPVTDGIEIVPAPVEEQPKVEPTEPAPKAQETPVENSTVEEDTTEESGAAADADTDTETNKTEDDVQTVVPVAEIESDPKTAPAVTEPAAEGEQDSTEELEDDKSNEVATGPTDDDTVEDKATDTAAESKQTTNETDEIIETVGTTESTETTVAAPAETPGSTNVTNAEPSAAVSSPEESQEAAPAAEESQETAPAAESEEQLEKKDGLSLFGLISKVLVGLGILSVVILVGCVYHYRYQMQKYKIAPFTPPSFLPECLFPRNTESSGRLISGYTELQVGNYQSAPRFAEI